MENNNNLIAGVDEAGRGPLAGPVFAAAVILDQAITIPDLTDSKKLSAKKRETIAAVIKEQALAFAIAKADVAEIDEINILQASLLAMQRAVSQLTLPPQQVLVDGNQCPKVACAVKAIVNGDLLIPVISAASILAKVARDAEMVRLDALYPGYGLATHKGYGTKMHLAALDELGVSAIHRRSFKPVRDRCYVE